MTTDTAFDPTAPLPGPPDPWAFASQPSVRPAPPFHMTDMIAAEPALARRILAHVGAPGGGGAALADLIRTTLQAGEPIVVTGCGTSEHGAMGAVDILRDAARAAGLARASIQAAQAFELSLDPPSRGLVIGISHEGGTGATNGALAAARAMGARTAMVTVSGRSPAGAFADVVVETNELDQGWCHTVGYVSPLLAAAAVGALLSGRPLDAGAVADLLTAGTRDELGAERIAARLAEVLTCWSSHPAATGRLAGSSSSKWRRRRSCRRPTATSRHSCTAICRRPAPKRAWCSS